MTLISSCSSCYDFSEMQITSPVHWVLVLGRNDIELLSNNSSIHIQHGLWVLLNNSTPYFQNEIKLLRSNSPIGLKKYNKLQYIISSIYVRNDITLKKWKSDKTIGKRKFKDIWATDGIERPLQWRTAKDVHKVYKLIKIYICKVYKMTPQISLILERNHSKI